MRSAAAFGILAAVTSTPCQQPSEVLSAVGPADNWAQSTAAAAIAAAATTKPAAVIRGVPGAKLMRFVEQKLAPLKDVPAHGNRKLHLHPLVVMLVMSFYDPMIRSLRTIEANSVREPLTGDVARRMARSTTSDALTALDPQLLRQVIGELHAQVPDLKKKDQTLFSLLRRLVAADGSYFNTFANVTWALAHTKTNRAKQAQIRLNLQIDAASWVPLVVSISGGEACDGSEPDAVAKDLLRDVLYLIDRNFIDFDFLKAVLEHYSDFIVRMRTNAPAYKVVRELPLCPEDLAAGVLSDSIVQLTGRGAPATPLRCVRVRHASKPGEEVELLTSLTDEAIAAHVIGAAYQQRWQVELFFRWLKLWCNFDHLLNTSRNGITMQFYAIVIATLLMHIHLGRKVSKYTLLALRQIALGLATEEQMAQYLARRDRERELAEARRARKEAAKKS